MTKEIHSLSEKLTVLIIEDNMGDFVLIEDYLLEKFKNIDIVHYADYKSSIDYIKKSKEFISVILMDLNLPKFGGLDVINSVLDHEFDIPVIILTGYSDLEMAKKSLQIGIYDYLVKDEINPIILHKTITFALNRNSFVKEIELEKKNYEKLFNFNPQPTWLLETSSLKILNANIAAQIKYGYSLNEFLEMSFTELHPAKEADLLKINLLSEIDQSRKNNFTHLMKDGSTIKVDIYFRNIDSKSNDTLIVQSNDVTETLQHIDTIEIQNSKLRNIAWTQSHVVRAPISRILGIINLIEEEEGNFSEIQFWLKQLKISTNEMDDIVKNIVKETIRFEKE
jgi:PAS domain S-box-containing protein